MDIYGTLRRVPCHKSVEAFNRMHLDVTIRVGDLVGLCAVTDNRGSSTDAIATSQLREILCVVLWSFVFCSRLQKKHTKDKNHH
jgi:hypothetical protein